VKQALKSDANVKVEFKESQTWLVLIPQSPIITSGLILYPEGYQDIRMYAPIGRRLAEKGIAVVLLSRKEKIPPTMEEEVKRISAVMTAYPQVKKWFIGAHTWGADVAAYAANHLTDPISGVILWAGRFDAANSLAPSPLPVLMVYGSLDEDHTSFLSEVKPLLPSQTEWEIIPGGNRVNFANFGPMPADIAAGIDMTSQQEKAAGMTIDFMGKTLNANPSSGN
jgi:hypothetical protein